MSGEDIAPAFRVIAGRPSRFAGVERDAGGHSVARRDDAGADASRSAAEAIGRLFHSSEIDLQEAGSLWIVRARCGLVAAHVTLLPLETLHCAMPWPGATPVRFSHGG